LGTKQRERQHDCKLGAPMANTFFVLNCDEKRDVIGYLKKTELFVLINITSNVKRL
jgi:hypothetical protein